MNTKRSSQVRAQKESLTTRSFDEFRRTMMQDQVVRAAYDEARAAQRTARIIKDMRVRANLTQEKLAALVKVSQPNIARLERGEGARGPGLDLVRRVADACGVELVVGYRLPSAKSASGANRKLMRKHLAKARASLSKGGGGIKKSAEGPETSVEKTGIVEATMLREENAGRDGDTETLRFIEI